MWCGRHMCGSVETQAAAAGNLPASSFFGLKLETVIVFVPLLFIPTSLPDCCSTVMTRSELCNESVDKTADKVTRSV